MAKDPTIYLDDMLEAISQAEEAVSGLTLAEFSDAGHWQTRYAVQRCIEIISEASRHVPQRYKADYPTVPWREIAGIGNILRHEYRFVADEVIWNTVGTGLSELKAVLLEMRSRPGGTDPDTGGD